ncbi:hypothetical protein [Paraflavitalea pollutisoli]|uniref:hypothetical protein n=1 Tax=Paraflavitalea pollutisoli TaxID=3034143 RepID=UPI0023ECEFC6|nr:hypothetical protein [Paraflavitalea sp. H1-2-19X]
MKKLLFVLLSVGLAVGASAQKRVVVRGGGPVVRPRMSVGMGFGYGPFYPYYGYGFNPWWGPSPYAYGYNSRPSRLDLEVQDIKQDYTDRIQSVRLQDDMTGREKRQTIRQLRVERDNAVLQAQKDYYRKRSESRRKPAPAPDQGQPNDNNEKQENRTEG